MTQNVNDRVDVEVSQTPASGAEETRLPAGAPRRASGESKNVKLRTGVKAGGGDLDWGVTHGW